MSRLVLLLLSLLLSAVHAASKPNVVLFLVDDMGWMDSGVYGSRYYETPHMDAFAQTAMRFTQAYSQPLCSPTRASLMTGQYSARHGITSATGHQPPQAEGHSFLPAKAPSNAAMLMPESRNYLPTSQVTLAEVLHGAGYRTAHIGKWHLGLTQPHWPEAQGFDVAFHCHPDPGPPGNYFSPYGVLKEGDPKVKAKVGTITDGPAGEYIVDRQAAEAVKFIEENKDKPFFLNLWCYGVHGPWGHKPEYTQAFMSKKDPTGRQGNPIMASMLKSVDECFGNILKALKEQGLEENTLVIFTSDNGGNTHSNSSGDPKSEKRKEAKTPEMMDWQKWAGNQPPTRNTPLRDGKGTLYEGGTRVPLMWRWPGHIQAGAVKDSVVGCIDIYPTVLDLLALQQPAEHAVDGASYASVLLGQGELKERPYFNYFPHGKNGGGITVRQGDMKLIRWFTQPVKHELYDLNQDLSESQDLAAKDTATVQRLDALITDFLAHTTAAAPVANPSYKPRTAASPMMEKDPMGGLKERGCKLTIEHGAAAVLTPQGNGKQCFLGYAAAGFSGPATLEMTVRTATAGQGRVESHPKGSADPEGMISSSFQLSAGDWQTITVSLDTKDSLGVLRIWWPTSAPTEIRRMQLKSSGKKTVTWEW